MGGWWLASGQQIAETGFRVSDPFLKGEIELLGEPFDTDPYVFEGAGEFSGPSIQLPTTIR